MSLTEDEWNLEIETRLEALERAAQPFRRIAAVLVTIAGRESLPDSTVVLGAEAETLTLGDCRLLLEAVNDHNTVEVPEGFQID